MDRAPTYSKSRVAVAVICAALVLCLAPFIGQLDISPATLLGQGSDQEFAHRIFWEIRLPRVWLGFLAGGMLALSGMTFQTVFRNPLATPYTLGVSSGAALGAVLALKVAPEWAGLTFSPITLFSFLGGVGSIGSVWVLTGMQKSGQPTVLLLAGIMVSFFCSSLILLLQYLSDFSQVFAATRWLMGSLETVGASAPLVLLIFALLGAAIVFSLARELDTLALGDELASSRGVPSHRTRLIALLASSLMVSAVVSLCGPIGFVGLMIPLASKACLKGSHRLQIPATFLFGGAFLCACDALARVIIAPAEMPVGVITALLGGPSFLIILRREALSSARG